MDCVCCAESQKAGTTPLCIASQCGHVECVRALLDGGAAINQALVGFASSMARHCRGLCGTPLPACMCSWWGALGCDAVEGSGMKWSSQCHALGDGEHHGHWLRHTCDT